MEINILKEKQEKYLKKVNFIKNLNLNVKHKDKIFKIWHYIGTMIV